MFKWLKRIFRRKKKPVKKGRYITISARITREQKEWLDQMKEKNIASISMFIRRLIDMCMTGAIYIEERGIMQRTYVVQQTAVAQKASTQPTVKQPKKFKVPYSPVRAELLKELKQVFAERAAGKIKIQTSQNQ